MEVQFLLFCSLGTRCERGGQKRSEANLFPMQFGLFGQLLFTKDTVVGRFRGIAGYTARYTS